MVEPQQHLRERYLTILCAVAALAANLSAAAIAAEPPPIASPLAPEASLAHFQIEPGLRLELVACEPQIVSPVAIRFDEQGRLWVVEMLDYPHGPKPGEKPASRISILRDTDGDGRYETAKVFADNLLFATGVQPWRGGVIVTLSGAVMFMQDKDGDDKVDTTETWYTGFSAENPQLRANHPRLMLDGKIYIANGLRGGNVVDARNGGNPVSISGMDFCFDPHAFAYEAVSGNGQFGMTQDDYGRRFVCSNRNPIDHVVLESRYLPRNPLLALPAVMQPVAIPGENSHVYPLTKAWTTSNLHAGQFTAACGLEIYRGDLLPEAYYGNAFTCEPTGSLVHREIMRPAGGSFTSKPAAEGKEFLASPDSWFRPVNLETGPDGALYVVDMYRAVIEHPQFMPDELKNRPDMLLGRDRGRIYRVVPADAPPRKSLPLLAKATDDELMAVLAHKNVWQRETGFRLLVERRGTGHAEKLSELARKAEDPRTRVLAMSLLSSLSDQPTDVFVDGMSDPDPRVRERALLLSEKFPGSSPPALKQALKLVADSDARVRFQAVLSLGSQSSDEVTSQTARLALSDADDPWLRAALACSVPGHAHKVLLAMLASSELTQAKGRDGRLILVRQLADLDGARLDPDRIGAALSAALVESLGTAKSAYRDAVLLGVAQGIERRGKSFATFVAQLPAKHERLRNALHERIAISLKIAADAKAGEASRREEISLLRYSRSDDARVALLKLVQEAPSQVLKVAAIESIAAHDHAEIGPVLLRDFQSQTPAVRRAVLDAVIPRPERASLLLDELAAGRIARAELDLPRTQRLLQHGDPAVKAKAGKLLAVAPNADRQKVLAEYQGVLKETGDPFAGKEIFRKNCSTCHHIGDVGVDVAPDISDSRVKLAEQLLTDILDPNRAIDNNYIAYNVVMADGKVYTGVIVTETASSITLKQPENKVVSLLRADIESLRSSGVSLMPEGLEKTISPAAMADLISFIKNWRYLDGAVPTAGK